MNINDRSWTYPTTYPSAYDTITMYQTGFFQNPPAIYGNIPAIQDRVRIIENGISLKEARLLATVNYASSVDEIVEMRNALDKIIKLLKAAESYESNGGVVPMQNPRSINDPNSLRHELNKNIIPDGFGVSNVPGFSHNIHSIPTESRGVNPNVNIVSRNPASDTPEYFSQAKDPTEMNTIVSRIFDDVKATSETKPINEVPATAVSPSNNSSETVKVEESITARSSDM